tara:strand:- start:114 stop:260 length:147 start_codon:yes stop_codon:yes gene_type:complete
MTCYKAEYYGDLKANSEIEEIKWLNYNNLEIISKVYEKYSHSLIKKGN